MKRIFTMLLSLIIVITATPMQLVLANQSDATFNLGLASGTCGENVTWELDANGVLCVSGSGEMKEYDWDDLPPWNSYAENICTVEVQKGVTSISPLAFWECINLKRVSLPEGLISIGWSAFGYCSNLKNITLPEGLSNIGQTAFYNCASLTEITIPSSMTTIAIGTFAGCTSLQSVSLPDSLTGIGNSAFARCSSLESIDLPPNITAIEGQTFQSCEKLKAIVLPDGVTRIDYAAFDKCKELTEVTLPEKLERIWISAFGECTELAKVYYLGTEKDWAKITIEDGNENLLGATISYAKEISEPTATPSPYVAEGICGNDLNWALNNEGTLIIFGSGKMKEYDWDDLPPWNSYAENICTVEVQKGVTSISPLAFWECINLKRVSLPEGLISIGWSAFGYCSNLKNITLPEGLSNIGQTAFYNCASLTEITIPSSMTTIAIGTFDGCTSLQSVSLPDSLTGIGNSAFACCSSLESIDLPPNITAIEGQTFQSCEKLKAIVLPDGVTRIDYAAFDKCKELTEVTLPEKLERIWISAFGECTELAKVYYLGTEKDWAKITIKDGNENLLGATISYAKKMCKVIWKNFDGTILAEEEYKQGAVPTYKGATPKYKDFNFIGWDPKVDEVLDDMIYTAQYDYTGICWVEENGVQVGYYYVDGSIKKGAGIVQVGDYLYYVLSTGKIAVGGNKTVSDSKTNGLTKAGTYYFYKNGVLETDEVRLNGEVRWREENGKQIGEYYVMNELRKDVGLVEIWNDEADELCWYYVLYSGKVKKNNVADGKRVNQTVKDDKLNKYAGPKGTYSFYEDGVMYDPYATETGIVKYDEAGKPWYYVDGHIRKDAGLVLVTRGEHEGDYVFVTYSGTLKKGAQTIKESKCNGHTEFIGTQKFDNTTGAMIMK